MKKLILFASIIVAGTETLLKGLIVDDHFVGVSAVGIQGAESVITFAGLPARR